MVRKALLAAVALLAGFSQVMAADLVIGARSEPPTDPHYFFSGNNIQFYRHYLGYLILADEKGGLVPSLAESYEVKDSGWVFHLRPNVVFSDGSTFDAEDVIASYTRARDYEKAIGTYAGLFTHISSMESPDPLTVVINTKRPYPNLAYSLTMLAVVPSEVAKKATQADFNTTAASVSSGPFRFVRFTAGQELVLERNPNYWGKPAVWDTVTFRFITDPSARVAALLAGTVDMIDGVPPEFVKRISEDKRFTIHSTPSMRNLLMSVDHRDAPTPFVTDNDGTPLKVNPFRDKRVRQALSIAIDREAIKQRVMEGYSFHTSQLVARGLGGYSEAIKVPTPDPAKAKALLAEAGYPNGFKLTLTCSRDRYVNDVKVCQAIAQMLTRVGIRTDVTSIPGTAYFQATNPDQGKGASVWMSSWSAAGSGEADVIYHVLHTFDPKAKTGTWNRSRYSNAKLDSLAETFMATMDQAKRRALMREAMELAMGDYAMIPIHDQSVIVATKNSLKYDAYTDESTIAYTVVPK
jgi:peptide/nickel transport system substrate-binding protein